MRRNLNRLRAALVRDWSDHEWRKKDQKRCRRLTAGNEAQRHAVMWSLRGSRDDLVVRMQACGEVDEHDNMRRCGVPLCPRCLMLRRGAETKKVIRDEYAGVPNEELALLTVLMPVDPDLAAMNGIMKRAELRLRNFISRHRDEDQRWNAIHLVGYWELDRLRADEVAAQGRNTRLFLDQSGMPVTAAEMTLWLPHFHAIVALGEVSREEFASSLRSYGYNAAYQVDMRGFNENRSVEANLKSVVRYANKFRVEHDFKGPPVFEDAEEDDPILFKRTWWPQDDMRAYADWLCGEHSGFQSMRLRIGRKALAKEPKLVTHEKSDADVSDGISSAVLRSVEECSRYNNTVQDTNWLPSSRPMSGGASAADDGLQPVDDLFCFAAPKASASLDVDGGLPERRRHAPATPRPAPETITSDRLRQLMRQVLQRRA